MRYKYLLMATVLGTPIATQSANAQASPSAQQPVASVPTSGLEEITVTARRQSENLQRVPIAVTAFNPKTLAQANITTVTDVAQLTPSLAVTQSTYGPLGALIAIRGQQVQDQQLILTPSVGIYIDDVYQGSTATVGALGVQDAASVEVLKGPQGTLYGRNTTGGALKIDTPLPSLDKLEGGGSAGIGNQGIRQVSGNISIPLIDDALAFRVSGNLSRSTGYGENLTNGDRLGGYNIKSARAALRIKPTDTVEVILRGDVIDGTGQTPPRKITAIVPGSPVNEEAAAELGLPLTQAGLAAAYKDLQQYINRPGYNGYFNGTNEQTVKEQEGSATLIWRPNDALTLKSITAYQHVNTIAIIDEDATPFAVVQGPGPSSGQNFDQFTEEFQAIGNLFDDKLNYTVGYYHYNLHGRDHAYPTVFADLAGEILDNDTTVHDTSDAGYAQLRYKLTPKIRLNGGIRYTKETVIADVRNSQTNFGAYTCNVPVADRIGGECAATFPNRFSNISFQGGVDADLAKGVLGYVSISRGFKAGGVNVRGTADDTYSSFAPEIATNYEVGVKSELFDHKVRLNVAAFYTDYSNVQRTVFVLDAGGNPSSQIQNAAKAKIKGVEAELTVRPTSRLTLSANGSYIDSKYTKYIVPATGVNLSGVPFPGIPKWQMSFQTSYGIETPFGLLTASGDVSYRSKVDFVPDSHLAPSATFPSGSEDSTIQKGYALLNARLALELRKNVELALWGKNLTNKYYAVAGQDQAGAIGVSQLFIGASRTYGAEVSFHF